MSDWHLLDPGETLKKLGSDSATGLEEKEARRRLGEHGRNELIEKGGRSSWRILGEQFAALLVILLLVAASISIMLGEYADGVAILVIVVLNAFLGFSQEYRAERSIAALRKLAVPTVQVRRDGEVQEISSTDLAPGDIVLLQAGNVVPADCRLLEASTLKVQESALTGESEPVEKDPRVILAGEVPLAERRTMVYMGTLISYGRASAVVTETGMDTELGRIASMMQRVEDVSTPLERRLNRLGRILTVAALALIGVVAVLGLWRGEELKMIFRTAVSMAVAAVPEGLPAVVTIALALGAQRMLKRNALIRKLSAVESLGSVTVICSDKTGTLTQNRMTVEIVHVAGRQIELEGCLDRVLQSTSRSSREDPIDSNSLALLLAGGALCNDASLKVEGSQPEIFETIGDPTEGALLAAAARAAMQKDALERVFTRVADAPFDSDRKRMTTVHQLPDEGAEVPQELQAFWRGSREGGFSLVAFTKGAVDGLLQVSSRILTRGHVKPLNETKRREIQAADQDLAQKGYRVLGIAYRFVDSAQFPGDPRVFEDDLIFVGMVGMADPIRLEAEEAVGICKAAGIRPVMITGDHSLTARSIAQELGIATDGKSITGEELHRLAADELQRVIKDTSVYARVAPEHKLDIIEGLQRQGQIVAMTGDGVNDAPALKAADIGVAMGVTGTDVAKEAADIVLQDDNFATIVAAVKEGRVIFDNIRRFVQFILASNSGELWVMLLAPFLGMPLPLLPIQILWMNLVTDGLAAPALGVEPAEEDVMKRPPRRPEKPIIGWRMGIRIIWVGLLMGLVSLAVGYVYWHADNPNWQTILFVTLVCSQITLALAARSDRNSLFRVGLFSNMPLLGALLLTFGLQMAVVYGPFLPNFLQTNFLRWDELAVCLILSTLPFWVVEISKWAAKRGHSYSPVRL